MRAFLVFALLMFAQLATANDGSIAFLMVKGIDPGSNSNNSAMAFGGKGVKSFAEALPVVDVMGTRGVTIYSASWALSLHCGMQVYSEQQQQMVELQDGPQCDLFLWENENGRSLILESDVNEFVAAGQVDSKVLRASYIRGSSYDGYTNMKGKVKFYGGQAMDFFRAMPIDPDGEYLQDLIKREMVIRSGSSKFEVTCVSAYSMGSHNFDGYQFSSLDYNIDANLPECTIDVRY